MHVWVSIFVCMCVSHARNPNNKSQHILNFWPEKKNMNTKSYYEGSNIHWTEPTLSHFNLFSIISQSFKTIIFEYLHSQLKPINSSWLLFGYNLKSLTKQIRSHTILSCVQLLHKTDVSWAVSRQPTSHTLPLLLRMSVFLSSQIGCSHPSLRERITHSTLTE
jgi:hypothetical protein